MSPYLLLLIGVLLVYVEFYVPGAVLGAAGALCILGSVVLYCMQADSLLAMAIFFVAAVGLTAGAIKLALHRIRESGSDNSLFLNSDQEGFTAAEFDESLVGKSGVALSDLKPSGHIEVEGERHQAISKHGYLKKGADVVVEGGQSAYLVVKRKED